MPRPGFVYILASARNGTLYVGVTSELVRRIWQHRTGALEGFTREHGITRLVYVGAYPDIRAAIVREKRLKKWRRAWKVDLIEQGNPQWLDLYPSLAGEDLPAPPTHLLDSGSPRSRG